MKQGWDVRSLNEFCEFGNGLWTGKKPPFQNVGVIRNTNFTKDGRLDDTDIVYLDVESSQFSKRKLQYGDIILEKSGGGPKQPVGRVIIFDKEEGDFSFSNFTSVIRISNKNTVDFNYLHRFLFFSYVSGATETMQSHSTGIRNLKFDDYKAIKVPLPPLQEQQTIVAILDEAFAAIAQAKANAEQNLQNAKELFESYLQSVFENKGEGWEEKTLNQISENLDSKRVPITKNVRKEGSIPYYGASGVVDYVADFLFDEDLLCISEDGANLLARTYSIAFSISGKTWVNNHAHVLRFESMISQKFVELYLNSIKLDDYVSGMAQPKLNQTMLNKIKIPYPPLKEQQIIVQKLDALSTETKQLEVIYQQKINDLDELKKSILQKAFAGELNTTALVV
jgi:type I restriction enzyme S subunit